MSYTARAAINTLLQVSAGGSPESWVTIAGISSINGPSFNVEVQDVTTHSNALPWRSKIPTLLDAGELSFDLFFDPSESSHSENSNGIVALFLNRVKTRWRLKFPPPNNTSYFICEGFCSRFEMQEPVDGVLTASCTITWTGAPEVNLE